MSPASTTPHLNRSTATESMVIFTQSKNMFFQSMKAFFLKNLVLAALIYIAFSVLRSRPLTAILIVFLLLTVFFFFIKAYWMCTGVSIAGGCYRREQWKERKATLELLEHVKKELGNKGVRCHVLEKCVRGLEERQRRCYKIVGEGSVLVDEEKRDEGEVARENKGEKGNMDDRSGKVFMFRSVGHRKR